MNLPYAHKLLVAADEQRHGFIKLRGSLADNEVRLMAAAGLIDATFNDGGEGSYTSINRLTDNGKTFLRAFKDKPIPDENGYREPTRISPLGVTGKWEPDLDPDLSPFRAVA